MCCITKQTSWLDEIAFGSKQCCFLNYFLLSWLIIFLTGLSSKACHQFGSHPCHSAPWLPPSVPGLWWPAAHHALPYLCHHTHPTIQSHTGVRAQPQPMRSQCFWPSVCSVWLISIWLTVLLEVDLVVILRKLWAHLCCAWRSTNVWSDSGQEENRTSVCALLSVLAAYSNWPFLFSCFRSPTVPYPMMMLPNGQTVPVLPGPMQMPSVISVSLKCISEYWNINMWSIQRWPTQRKRNGRVGDTCLFVYCKTDFHNMVCKICGLKFIVIKTETIKILFLLN